MYYNKECKFINSMDDIQGLVDDELFKVIEGFIEDEIEIIDSDFDNLKSEFEVYEQQLEDLRNIANETKDSIETILASLENGKRINRQHLIKDLKLMISNMDY